ncbi:MAG: phosphopentomutase [Armatimonadetes bacterium]|nr:phosphopentomutase [Armatimonadota bacterium]
MKRAIVIVLDGCGAGFAPDAAAFNDPGEPSTIKHVWDQADGIVAPNMSELGFFRCAGCADPIEPLATSGYGRLRPLSMGKDSVTGHWEMMGIVLEKPFPTFPNGFPIPVIKKFEDAIGTQTIGNRASSGTVILDELGPFHQETGFPIVYTSADSVFQIACDEAIVPIEKLYEYCRIARELCVAPNDVQRVIARPFVGSPGAYKRTERRKDFPVIPPKNLVDEIGDVFGIGVVPELFDGRGFRQVKRTQNNAEHLKMLMTALDSDARFIFANFEDTDMLFGHRNDAPGFAGCLETFDGMLAEILERLGPDDLLIITSDHGNDPTDESTDHTREYSPVVIRGGVTGDLGDQDGLGFVGRLVREHLA